MFIANKTECKYFYLDLSQVLQLKPYGRPVDMWACGVIMYILLVGYQPFYHDSEWRMRDLIKAGDFEMSSPSWRLVTVEARDLITRFVLHDINRAVAHLEPLE